ncbi:MAG: (d)CMP kinase [Pseudomonadota bacterium]
MNELPPVVTIDGAGGTGKGSAGHALAKILGWHLLDSGVLYRVLAMAAMKHHVTFDNEPVLEVLATHLDVQFIETDKVGLPPRVLLDNEDVTDAIRTEKMGNAASKVGTLATVRIALLERQREFRKLPGLVTDGRDMGTIVFPDAEVKVFLTASAAERARRRHIQLKEKGINVNLDDLVEELRERDRRDSERAVAPLKAAEDALMIDTDTLTIDQVVEIILTEVKKWQQGAI